MSKFKDAKVETVTADFFLVNPEKLLSCPDRTLEQGLKEIQRELWVRKWFKVASLHKDYGEVVVSAKDSYTFIAIVDIRDEGSAPYMGWAKCSRSDRYDSRVGVAVATARAYGEPIPDYI